jgi:predicted nucleotidyltransferase
MQVRPPKDFAGFLRQRKEQARRAAQEAARKRNSLKGLESVFIKYGVARAYVFGSVTSNSCRSDSDIDLYVEGVAPESYWDLWKETEEYTREHIDLYCDRDNHRFIEKIKERGELIYEA